MNAIALATGGHALVLALLAAGCQPSPELAPSRIADAERRLESVLGWRVERDTLIVQAHSNGCTTKDSFEIDIFMAPQSWTAEVELVRREPDRCEAVLPQGVTLEWTRAELGVPQSADIRLANPIGR